jgi:hypothetical protein
LEFEVARGGLLDVKLKITDPYGQSVIDKIAYFNKEDDAANEAEGRVSFSALHTGKYSICFDNTMSRWTAKVISFFVLNDAAKDPKDSIAKLTDLGPVVDSVIKIADELDSIETLQHHMRVREQSHRDGKKDKQTMLGARPAKNIDTQRRLVRPLSPHDEETSETEAGGTA